jgi:SAM-dependent methyltransferase
MDCRSFMVMTSHFNDRDVVRLTEQYDIEARAYLDHWAPIVHPAGAALVDELPGHNVERALDIGAGAGLLLPVIQRRFRGAHVVGVDRSEGLVILANPDASLAVADAANLGILPGTFDLVVMAFMLYHLPNPSVGLAEARRISRAGAVLGLTTWAGDVESPAVIIWNEELEAHGAVSGDALRRIARHDLMDSPEKVRGLLEGVGFRSVRAMVREFTHRIESEEFIRLRTRVGGTRQRLESMDEGTRRRCVERARKRISGLTTDDLVLRMPVVLATARYHG